MLIQTENLRKSYRVGEVAIDALAGVSLTVDRGDFVAIMGASGSGKSTLLNIFGCLDVPTSGRYALDGEEVGCLDRRALADVRNRKLGFVFQSFNLLSRTSAIENVELPMYYGGVRRARRERLARAEALLRRVGLGDRMHHHPRQLSGGQQQRVAIARALANDPPLLLADEPTGNLDSRSSAEIMALFQELNASGITIVMVTHEDDIARAAKRTITMRDGRVV